MQMAAVIEDIQLEILKHLDPFQPSGLQALHTLLTASRFLFEHAARRLWSVLELSNGSGGPHLTFGKKRMSLQRIQECGSAWRSDIYLRSICRLFVYCEFNALQPSKVLPWIQKWDSVIIDVVYNEAWCAALQDRCIREPPRSLTVPAREGGFETSLVKVAQARNLTIKCGADGSLHGMLSHVKRTLESLSIVGLDGRVENVAAIERYLNIYGTSTTLELFFSQCNILPFPDIKPGSAVLAHLIGLNLTVDALGYFSKNVLQSARHTLRWLVIDIEKTHVDLSVLACLKRLENLTVDNMATIGPNAHTLPNLPSLRSLDITTDVVSVASLGVITAAINACPLLRRLRISARKLVYGSLFHSLGAKAVDPGLRLTGLQVLSLSFTFRARAAVDVIDWALVTSEGLPRLKELSLSGVKEVFKLKKRFQGQNSFGLLRDVVLDRARSPVLNFIRWDIGEDVITDRQQLVA
ncbi:hypothetical protein HK101_010560 [Irineochytrium annulatum]|nr:hypothetical protein HK101_010560 [Irineochytrium annulatum]